MKALHSSGTDGIPKLFFVKMGKALYAYFRKIFFTPERRLSFYAIISAALCFRCKRAYLPPGRPQRAKDASPLPVGTFLASPPWRVVKYIWRVPSRLEVKAMK